MILNNNEFNLQLRGYRLTTVEILYRLPDYPDLLQSYIFQQYDISPNFPMLHDFLEFWEKNIEGKLFSVQVSGVDIISPTEYRACTGEFLLH